MNKTLQMNGRMPEVKQTRQIGGITIKEMLRRIYTAHQCHDLNDVDIALQELDRIIRHREYFFNVNVCVRLAKLTKRREELLSNQKGKNAKHRKGNIKKTVPEKRNL